MSVSGDDPELKIQRERPTEGEEALDGESGEGRGSEAGFPAVVILTRLVRQRARHAGITNRPPPTLESRRAGDPRIRAKANMYHLTGEESTGGAGAGGGPSEIPAFAHAEPEQGLGSRDAGAGARWSADLVGPLPEPS